MDRRTIWAILLMMVIAFIPTFFIKKPVKPVAGVVSDTTHRVDSLAPAPTLAPAAGAPVDTTAAAPEQVIAVSTPLARYGGSTRGGRLTTISLQKYTNQVAAKRGQPADLVEPEAPLLDLA